MFIPVVNLIKINCIFFINKLNLINTYLIALNKLSLNVLVIFYLTISVVCLKNSRNVFVYLSMTVLLVNLFDFFFINSFYQGYFKIHPTLFYFFIVMYAVVAKKYQNVIKQTKFINTVIGIVCLFLGGLWALHQLSWGHYWSNDSIEIALLLLILNFLHSLHKIKFLNTYKNFFYLIVILYINLLRMGLIYTKHNFFNITNLFYKYASFFIFWITIFLCFFICSLKKKQNKNVHLVIVIFSISTILYLNYTYVYFINKTIKEIFKICIILNLLMLDWKNINRLNIHVMFFVTILIFNYYTIQYFLFTNFKQLIVQSTNNYLHKQNLLFFDEFTKYVKKNDNNKINKYTTKFNYINTQKTKIIKMLLNYV